MTSPTEKKITPDSVSDRPADTPSKASQRGKLTQRVGGRLRDMGTRGQAALNQPGTLPNKGYGWFRRWLRKIWNSYGGGLYALGFAVSFAWLEINELLFDDIPGFIGIVGDFGDQIFPFIVDFFIDTFRNILSALLWPVDVALYRPPWGAVALGLAFYAFDKLLKEPTRNWLFHDALDDEQPTDDEG